jgi:hypothetical protein
MHYLSRRGGVVAAFFRKLPVLCAATLALSAAVTPAHAQGVLRGQIEKDSIGVSDVSVTLHRVTRDSAGAVSSTRSGAGGTFSITLPPADTSGFTVFFATAEYQGIRYFGPPLHTSDARSGYRLEVFDTARITPGTMPEGVGLVRRDVILLREPQGGWEVNEVVTVKNGARRTWVPDPGRASWSFLIPKDVGAFEVGDGGTPPDEVRLMGERVLVTTPLTPGSHEALVRYRLPATSNHYVVTPDMSIDTVQLFVKLPAPQLEIVGVSLVDTVSADGQRFARYSALNVKPGTKLSLGWKGPATAPVDPVKAAVVVLLIVLAGGAVMALRHRRTPPARPAAREPANAAP